MPDPVVPPSSPPVAPAPGVEVEVTVAPTLNFAMEQSGVPLVSGLRVRNSGAEPLVGAVFSIQLEPELGPPTTVAIETLRPGEEAWRPVVDVRLPPGRLRGLVEAERARASWTLICGDAQLAAGEAPVEVLAFQEWPGLRAPPALVAAFVMPNHPVVGQLLGKVRDQLQARTQDPSISGYQTRSPKRVIEQVEALVAAIQSMGVTYVGVPASFESVGQKVRLPDMVLSEGMGNCLDISVLLAGCLEQMGLAPLVVVVKGHAFPAVWLVDDRFPEGVVHDAARLRTLGKLGQVLVFDSSTVVHGSRPPLAAAVAAADAYVADDANFVCAVDVRVVRMDRFRPLPVRMTVAAEEAPSATSTLAAQALLDQARRVPEPAAAPAGPPPPPEPIVARFKRWRDKLLDLSLNNRLLNYRPTTKASLPLQVPDLARFEDLLANDVAFEVLPRPDVDPRDQRDEALVKARGDEAELEARRRADLDRSLLYAGVTREELLVRAVELDRAARTDREEGGANTLFAAIGMLRWFESPSSELPRLAPLILVPVRLEYDRVSRRIRLRRLDEESVGNVTLAEKLRRDYAVDLSALTAPDLDDHGLDVPALLRRAREAIQQTPRWEVLDEVHLGLFTFTKFLMWKDLDSNADALLQSPVVRHLAQGGLVPFQDPVGAPDATRLDDDVPPSALPTVLDCDSTQLSAISAALRGRSFVLQGPPGTGKSQTITNLIAAALGEGKTVLFVSEKMAALDVVHRRLLAAGLGDYCLELHSNKANKKEVALSLGRALDRVGRPADSTWDTRSGELGGVRAQLNGYARALHQPRSLGRTFYEASARLLELHAAPEVAVPLADPAGLTAERWAAMEQALDAFATAAAEVEPAPGHPWRASAAVAWSAGGEQALVDAITAAIAAVDADDAATAALAAALGISPTPSPALLALGAAVGEGASPAAVFAPTWPTDLARARAWVTAAREERDQRADLALRWQPGLHHLNLPGLFGSFRSWAGAFFLFAWLFLFLPKQNLGTVVRGRLPPDAQITADLGVALALRRAREAREREQAWAAATFAGHWEGADPDTLAALLDRVERLRSALAGWRADALPAPEVALALVDAAVPSARRDAVRDAAARATECRRTADAARASVQQLGALTLPADARPALTALLQARPLFRKWVFYRRAGAAVEALGLAAVVRAHEAGTVPAAQVGVAAERALLSRWVAAIRDGEPALRDFDGAEQGRRVARFRELDRGHITLGRQRVLARLDARRPGTGGVVPEGSETGIVGRESKKQRGHWPVRKLLLALPNLLPRLKPCLLMSPLSIAQYLPAGGRRFDLVVFDEASQIGTHDAIGAIARGEQVVIVGDSRQLPPTTFFTRDTEEESLPDDNDIVEMESILDEAIASRLPEQMLGWHYRSRHEALIDFSNRHYYDNRLNVFPAARGKVADLGVRWHGVPNGVYDKGRTRQNRAEAEALVGWLVRELRHTAAGARTYGVVTFSVPQQTLIQDMLDRARGEHPELEPHFADGNPEAVFVKNLENVQGDERDVILFSIGYGPDEAGKVWMNFGPLNRKGGERRLNVAVTRARRALHVFSTLTADHVDLSRTTALGARHLKAFLQYAMERGSGSARVVQSAPFESEFERQVHDALVELGYTVDGQVGCGGYRIDLAVVHPDHPGEYLLGVECDGAPYHSAATARDRDRLRQQVLQDLGWRLHRVWSTDWWFDRAGQVAKLEAAVREALAAPREAPPEVDLPEPEEEEPAAPLVAAVRPAEPSPVVPYRLAVLAPVSADPETMYVAAATPAMLERALAVIAAEAPLRVDELCRRVSSCWGVGRVTSRVRSRVGEVLAVLGREGKLVIRGDFAWAPGSDPAVWATLRGADADGGLRDAEAIPPEEIAAAAAWVLARTLSLDEPALAREVARLFGLTRLGRKVDEAMRVGIELLVSRGKAAREGERVAWRG